MFCCSVPTTAYSCTDFLILHTRGTLVTCFSGIFKLLSVHHLILNLDDLVSVLKASAKLVQKIETWNQRFRSLILTGIAFCYWIFLCFHVVVSDANIGIMTNFLYYEKTQIFCDICARQNYTQNGDSNFFIVIFSLNTLFYLVMNSKTIIKQDG